MSSPARTSVRTETPGDHDAVRELNRRAFGQEDEAELVDRLREEGYARLSLVAVSDGRVVGHILFSDLPIQTRDGPVPALSLAPMAVLPEHQRRGIGSELVCEGLRRCQERGHRIVLVVGHPEFYPRFGFSHELTRAIDSPFSGQAAFMATELVPRALQGVRGRIQFPPPFEPLL